MKRPLAIFMNTDALTQSTQGIVNTVQHLSNEQLLAKPTNGGWCVAEVIEHLGISDRTALFAMKRGFSEADAAHKREVDIKLKMMERAQDFAAIAPEAANPKGIYTQTAEALEGFTSMRNSIAEFVKDLEPDLLATGFEHPRLGYLTRAQWVAFITWHANHHHKQILRILGAENPA